MASLSLFTGPTEEPITIDEAKEQIRESLGDQDTRIRSLITAARRYCETVTKRQICTATWDYRLDCFPAWEIGLPLPPLQSITSITYVDTDGATQTFSSSKYLVDAYSEPGRVTPVWDQIWPTTRWQNNAVTIRFVAGYGAASAVPDSIKHAIKMHVQMNYDAVDEDRFLKAIDRMLSPDSWGCYA